MRLLNSKTYELKEFFGKHVPKYAILSHRWEDGEVSFQDMATDDYKLKAGFGKIKGTCARAVDEGHDWVWIDTCCIDKTSSAELSEAINSMFAWYERSQVCYAYLSDVPYGFKYMEHFQEESAFRRSLWFTRGWTLQELLAPGEVLFLDREWMVLSDKRDDKWMKLVTEITGISDLCGFRSASVAQKMSWLSRRETTRIEDMAYCMLGIFGVFMPPLYGEEENSFHRLQLEILKVSDDESIFAWRAQPGNEMMSTSRGLLARFPSEFKDSTNVLRDASVYGMIKYGGMWRKSYPYSVTNKGIAIQPPLKLLAYDVDGREGGIRSSFPYRYEATFDCWNVSKSHEAHQVCIYLVQAEQDGPLKRIFANHFARLTTEPSHTDMLISQYSIHEPDGRILTTDTVIYVPESPYSHDWRYDGIRSSEFDIIGDSLRGRLQRLRMDDYGNNAWVEPRAFNFKATSYEDRDIIFSFTERNPDATTEKFLIFTFKVVSGVMWCFISKETKFQIQLEETRFPSAIAFDETYFASRGDSMPLASLENDDILVSQPLPGVFHFKLKDIPITPEALRDSKVEVDEDENDKEGYANRLAALRRRSF